MNNRNNYYIGVSQRNRSAMSKDLDDFNFHSDKRSLKANVAIDPFHSDVVEHIFPSNPGAGETECLRIEHGYPYTPAHMVMVSPDWIDFYSDSGSGRGFARTPVALRLDFETGSIESIVSYADRRFLYVFLNRTGTTWDNINGQSLFIKYSILDVQGME